MTDFQDMTGGRELVMVSNRLPVDRLTDDDGGSYWGTSPGGLVTAVEPIVKQLNCVWVGWAGNAGEHIEPFTLGGMRLVPIELSESEVADYYEGFSNATLWPLYHDVIARPKFHREWWDRYQAVNQRFAEQVAAVAAEGAIVWVHDYQLQLVPAILRRLRPDLIIAFFLHIPFPPQRIFAQLPWRRRIIEGMLGADVVGFQRVADAVSFRAVVEQYFTAPAHGNSIVRSAVKGSPAHTVLAQEFPISIDVAAFEQLATQPEVLARAKQIRTELGNPKTLMLGVDRLDYTKGIRHRLKAFDELLGDGEIDADDTVFVQVASPSRERVEAYQQLRDEVESTVGRINGEHGKIGRAPLVYLHQGFSRAEMVALYLAADVILVTPLRDGMNLVAKEYVASRTDEEGVLVLSEFAGAADELRDALLVNPHDIDGLKAAIVRAVHMPKNEQRRRMRAMRSALRDHDVARWTATYLGSVLAAAGSRTASAGGTRTESITIPTSFVPRSIADRIRRLASEPELIVASDFDGTLAPIVTRPEDAAILSRAQRALDLLHASPGVHIAILSGRSLAGLAETGLQSEEWIVSGSHGSEFSGLNARVQEGRPGPRTHHPLSEDEAYKLGRATRRFERALGSEPGVRLEYKPFGIAVHTREVEDSHVAEEMLAAAEELGIAVGMHLREGKQVREFSVRKTDKGSALRTIQDVLGPMPVLFLGDDVTDEDVFRSLGPDDVTIKVGKGETAAQERVPDPETATAVLALLAELRTGTVIGTESED